MDLTEKQFLTMLKKGRGDAYIYLMQCGQPGLYKDVILKAAVSDYGFDTQCEGTRASYYYSMIQLCRYKDICGKIHQKKTWTVKISI